MQHCAVSVTAELFIITDNIDDPHIITFTTIL